MGLSANQKEVFLFVALLFLISSGLFGIQRVQLAQLEGKYTANIVALEGDIKTLQQQLDADVQAANRNILDQRKILEQQISQLTKTDENVLQQLGTVQVSSQQEIMDISSQLQDIEMHNSLKLREIESKLGQEQQDFSFIVEQTLPSVVSINTVRGKGSGIIIHDDGYVVTNYHVVEETAHLSATTSDRQEHDVSIVGYDEATDIALLKFNDNSKHKAIAVRDSTTVKAGEKAFVFGNPLGLDFSVTEGLVSSAKRIGQGGIPYIQTDARINPGNSGGPLVDVQGNMIGMNTLKVTGVEGLGFALPSNLVMNIADRMMKEEKAGRK